MLRRMTLPSLLGVSPRSDFRMAFSMAGICDVSHGWMTSVLGSGTESEAIWLIGVCAP